MYYNGAFYKSVVSSLTKRKRSRLFWNILWIFAIVLSLLPMQDLVYEAICERLYFQEQVVYERVGDGYLYTSQGVFKISTSQEQPIPLDTFLETVEEGETIEVRISDLSNKVLMIYHHGNLVYYKYHKTVTDWIVFAIIEVTLLSLWVFMLIVTNLKNPRGRIKKLQREFVRRI